MNGPNKRKPQEGRKDCKVSKEGLYIAPNGMCKISTFDKEEKSRVQSFEEALKEEKIIERDEGIKWVMEEASFNNTIGEMEKVVDLSPHNQLLRIKLKCGLVCELTLRVNRHSNGQESPLSHHYVF